MRALYLDNHLLALDKPPDLLTQGTKENPHSLEEEAKAFLKKKFNKPGAVFLHPVHRLDKPVSGIVLFARTSKALSRLNKAMRERKVRKIYHALIEGSLTPPEGELIHLLEHGSHRAIVGRGKEAKLHYKTLEKRGNHSLIEVELATGRYHQIRAQLSTAGHPIVGDKKYGAASPDKRINLTHYKMSVPHPVTGEIVEIFSKYQI